MCAFIFLYLLLPNDKTFANNLKDVLLNLTKINQNTINFYYYFSHSLIIIASSLLISLILGIPIGSLIALKSNRSFSILFSLILYLIIAFPIFILAPLLIKIAEINDIPVLFLNWNQFDIQYVIYSLFLPIVLLILPLFVFITIISKNTIIKFQKQPFVLQMYALGMNDIQVYFKVFFKRICAQIFLQFNNILLFVITLSIIIERIFLIPGQSIFLIFAFDNKNISLIMQFIIINLLLMQFNYLITNFLHQYLNNNLIINKHSNFLKQQIINKWFLRRNIEK
ncbi:ABC transporter permease subunit [Mycoplasma sp. 1018B]|uniref:ABC transporter permease subunit n=1 Tax=Mycoplasma sp. 1018B TaxID=2967302 RepID=UPI00211B848B|nr:ABC transporter permease subunit [Mycoplasma sp. 1018B]UUM19276.1 ABC transporter permease subunit [Mycoplasma sp. 1018B]